ncbi:MAG TPA: helix-turn-helix transcriptional regulator [Micromonosporaceae bacterium]|jgi:transcriptional regulator with XRE-family HTH domain
MVLLRRVLGDALRSRRLDQDRTLRDVSTAANVSLGYLSEIERGQKEASSELLASICEALDVRLSEVLREASGTMVIAEEMAQMVQSAETVPATEVAPEPVGETGRLPEPRLQTTSIELPLTSSTDGLAPHRRDVVYAA